MQDFVKRFSDDVFTLSAESHSELKYCVHKRFKSWIVGTTEREKLVLIYSSRALMEES